MHCTLSLHRSTRSSTYMKNTKPRRHSSSTCEPASHTQAHAVAQRSATHLSADELFKLLEQERPHTLHHRATWVRKGGGGSFRLLLRRTGGEEAEDDPSAPLDLRPSDICSAAAGLSAKPSPLPPLLPPPSLSRSCFCCGVCGGFRRRSCWLWRRTFRGFDSKCFIKIINQTFEL